MHSQRIRIEKFSSNAKVSRELGTRRGAREFVVVLWLCQEATYNPPSRMTLEKEEAGIFTLAVSAARWDGGCGERAMDGPRPD